MAVPDETGLVMAALGAEGQEVVQVARLYVEGMESDMWTGSVCTTADGRYAAAVFAPSEFANHPKLRAGGAFGAVIDMYTGEVRPVSQRVTLAGHNPGCGLKGKVAFTTHPEGSDVATTVLEVDATDGTIRRRVPLEHQVTSAVPTEEGLTAASGRRILQFRPDGRVASSADLGGPVFDLKAAADGGVDALVSDADGLTAIHQRNEDRAKVLGRGPHGQLRLTAGRNGANRLAGKVTSLRRGARAIARARSAQAVGLDGTLLEANRTREQQEVDAFTVTDGAGSRTVNIRTSPAPATFTTSSTDPAAPPNYSSPKCAVSRTDYQIQVAQPTPAQVEWAVNRVVRNDMTVTRPAQWNLNGLPAYTPASLGAINVDGGGRIPAQVLLGILAQESNLKQAGKGALPGVPGNPLVGNYYGVVYAKGSDHNESLIVGMDYNNADCGYGIGQITTGMTAAALGPWSGDQKKMIATDYAANIQASALLLAEKWNLLRTSAYGATIANGGDPSKIENWYFAIWGYNSGIYAMPAPGYPHGVGWTNNPANPDYEPDRSPFLRDTYADAATPYKWPYQERVLGWARTPQRTYQGNPAYTGISPPPAGTYDPDYQPEPFSLCVIEVNKCDPNNVVPDDPNTPEDEHQTRSFCTDPERVCWWHGPATWPVGHTENTSAYVPGAPEPAAGPNPHPPACGDQDSPVSVTPGLDRLPVGAAVIDDVPDRKWNLVGCAARANTGSFAFTFAKEQSGMSLGRVDLHQIGAGLGGHFWYSHTIDPARTTPNRITGRWTIPNTSAGWRRLIVHIPDHGADTNQANYKIWDGLKWRNRVVNQRWNKNTWFDLGSFYLRSGSFVELSNATYDDWRKTSGISVAWDALAVAPSTKPTVSNVAFGDSYSAGEGVEPYFENSDIGAKTPSRKNKCHRSPQAWPIEYYRDVLRHRGPNSEFHFQACSSAVLQDLTGAAGQWGEVPMLSGGWLDENTTHVTLGIGGNDAGFSSILKGCTLSDCLQPDYRLNRQVELPDGRSEERLDDVPLTQAEPAIIDGLKNNLIDLLAAIGTRAPNAKIVLVGYPHVVHDRVPFVRTPPLYLDPGNRCVFAPLDYLGYNEDEVTWITQMTDRFVGVMAQAVRDAQLTLPNAGFITFVDIRAEYAGHGACNTGDEWINGPVAFTETGSGLDTPGASTFHPKSAGHDGTGRVLAAINA